jgi:hypothetical protein
MSELNLTEKYAAWGYSLPTKQLTGYYKAGGPDVMRLTYAGAVLPGFLALTFKPISLALLMLLAYGDPWYR